MGKPGPENPKPTVKQMPLKDNKIAGLTQVEIRNAHAARMFWTIKEERSAGTGENSQETK